MREKGSSPIGVGVLTVLTVLLVLILAVFSALTYTSARPIWPSPDQRGYGFSLLCRGQRGRGTSRRIPPGHRPGAGRLRFP